MTTRRTQDKQPLKTAASPLELRLGHTFAHPELLQLAITHRSYAYEARGGATHPPPPETSKTQISKQKNPPGTDNEQLEFLGDAILGLIVAEALFRAFPHSSEGELTRMRSALVSRKRMSEFGAALDLEQHLLLGKSAEQNGGRRKPALLANAAEAVLAAMYLDSPDKGRQAVHTLVHQHLIEPELDAMRLALAGDTGRGALRDHKTLLQERVQASASGRLRYIDVSQSGPAHQRQFAVQAQLEDDAGTHILASAEGPSKKEAQQRAAELALASWTSE